MKREQIGEAVGGGNRKKKERLDGGVGGLLLLLPTSKGQDRPQKVTSACSCAGTFCCLQRCVQQLGYTSRSQTALVRTDARALKEAVFGGETPEFSFLEGCTCKHCVKGLSRCSLSSAGTYYTCVVGE